MNPPELSIIILGYREGDRLPAFVKKVELEIQALGIPYEIVVVANYWVGSGDRTPQIAGEMERQNEHVHAVAKPKAGMMGWDMRSGMKTARGNVLAVIDGDGQFHPHDIVMACQEMRTKQLDLCQSFRVQRQDGIQRMIISKVFNGLFRILFPGTGLHDINAKPKLMTRKVYDSLRLTSTDWFIDAEIIIQARRHRYRMGEIPSVFSKRTGGASYIRNVTIFEFLKNMGIYRIRETVICLKTLFPNTQTKKNNRP